MLGVSDHGKYKPLEGDITRKMQQFDAGWTVGGPEGVFTVGDHGKQIIGFRITSGWNDGTNGCYKLHRGKVLEDEVKVEFIADGWRGCSWWVEAWMVPSILYDKKSA